jgi:Ca2+-binding RTX toxin-like protein
VNQSNVTITASSGNHMLFIGGSHDVAILTGGTENIQAYQGYNTITTGKGNDTIRFGGSGNTINAGAGNNALYDSGSSNKIVMPGPGQGFDDVYGPVLTNGDTLDFTAALKATAWDGSAASLSNYLRITMSGSDAIISMTSKPGAVYSKVADLHGVGQVNLSTLLAHSIT